MIITTTINSTRVKPESCRIEERERAICPACGDDFWSRNPKSECSKRERAKFLSFEH